LEGQEETGDRSRMGTGRGSEAAYRVALEGLEGPVAAQPAHVDAHVRAAGGEGGVVLPVYVQGGRCGRQWSNDF